MKNRDKIVVGIFFFRFFRTGLNETYVANVLFIKSVGIFNRCPDFYFFIENI